MAVIQLNFTVTGQAIIADEPLLIVTGSENVYECHFSFTSEWTGFEKTAVFTSQNEAREVLIHNNMCIMPWEVLEREDIRRVELKIGVYGVKDDMRMPTVYTKPILVHPGAETAEGGGDPTPTQWEQILSMLADGTIYVDATLTTPGKGADAAVTGAELKKAIQSAGFAIRHGALQGYTTADEFPANKIIELYSDVTPEDIANLPIYGELAYVITPTYDVSSTYSAQLFIGRSTIATRIKGVAGWSAWSQKANVSEVMRYLPLDYTSYASIAEIPEGVIFVLQSAGNWTDAPPNATHGYFFSARISANYKIQIFFEDTPKQRMWWRIVHRETFNIFMDWATAPTTKEFQTVATDTHKFVLYTTDYRDSLGITRLSQINENVILFATNSIWEDVPFTSGIFKNTRYSANYNIQEIYRYQSGQSLTRITKRSTGEPYTDWKAPNNIAAQKVLSMGDSICYGARNSHKGFLGDLYLSRKDASYPGARLSNTRISEANHFCIYQQFLDFVADAANADYAPDVLIADGGINDYGNNVVLGDIPTSPVTTDEGAETLNKATICGSIQYLFYLWIKTYPQAQRFFLLTHKDKTKPWTKNYSGGYTQTEMNEAIKAVCSLYGVKVIDVFGESMINTAFSQYISPVPYSTDHSVTNQYYVDNDGVHPLALGYKEGYIPLVREALKIGTPKEAAEE